MNHRIIFNLFWI